MRYANHNFFSNFANQNTDGVNISRDMVISEVAKAIEGKSVEVKDAVFKCGIKIDPNLSKSKLAEVLSGNIGKSKCLQGKLANIIIDNNLSRRNIEYLNSSGWGDFFKSPQFATLLGTAIGTTFGAVQKKQQAKEAEKQRQYELELAKINADALKNQLAYADLKSDDGSKASSGGNTGKIILYSLLGAGVLVGGFFLIRKFRK